METFPLVLLLVIFMVDAISAGQKCLTSRDVAKRDDRIAHARCPNGMFVHTCKCQGGKYCDGPTISGDGRTCRAHGSRRGGRVRAHACCKKYRRGVQVVSNPPIMVSNTGVGRKARKYKRAPTVNCPRGTRLINCFKHNYWEHSNRNQRVRKHGNGCKTSAGCRKCGVQAVCSKGKGGRSPPSGQNCLTSRGSAKGDDRIARARCPNGMFVHTCKCQGGKYCDGPTISGDGRTCRAHASSRGGRVRAHACCKKYPRGVQVVSNPPIMVSSVTKKRKARKYKRAPTVACPSGTSLINCFKHNYWEHSNRNQRVRKHGNGCKTSAGCRKCGVQAVCSKLSKSAPPPPISPSKSKLKSPSKSKLKIWQIPKLVRTPRDAEKACGFGARLADLKEVHEHRGCGCGCGWVKEGYGINPGCVDKDNTGPTICPPDPSSASSPKGYKPFCSGEKPGGGLKMNAYAPPGKAGGGLRSSGKAGGGFRPSGKAGGGFRPSGKAGGGFRPSGKAGGGFRHGK